MMNGQEKSNSAIVAEKPTNGAGRPAEEPEWLLAMTAQFDRTPSIGSTMTQNSDPVSQEPAAGPPPTSDIIYPSAVPFVLVHLACFGAIWTGVTPEAAAIGVGLYWLRILAIGAGYHRYFAHRAYETSRVFQFVLAVMSQSTALLTPPREQRLSTQRRRSVLSRFDAVAHIET